MEFVKKLLESVEYKNRLRKLKEMEQDRVYCRHDLDHFLHVARIACLLSVEQGLELDKEQVYLCALLHDLGRAGEYRGGASHEEESLLLAERILPDCGYTGDEQEVIRELIGSHRGVRKRTGLAASFYRADKESRCCFACPAEPECHWAADKKNKCILV